MQSAILTIYPYTLYKQLQTGATSHAACREGDKEVAMKLVLSHMH